MLSLLLFAITPQSETLTFVEKGARVPVVIQEISAKTGVALQTGAGLQNRVLCLSVHNASLEKTLNQIAYVLDGEWTGAGKTRRLIPSRSIERQAEIRAENEMSKALTKELADLRTENDIDHPYNLAKMQDVLKNFGDPKSGRPSAAKTGDYATGDPNTRLLVRLLGLISQQTLVKMRDGDRTVYSNYPNQMQLALPEGADDILTEYRRDWNDLQSIIPQAVRDQAAEDDDDNVKPLLLQTLPANLKFDLCVERMGSLSVHLKVFDEKRTQIESALAEVGDIGEPTDDPSASNLALLDPKVLLPILAKSEHDDLKLLHRFLQTAPERAFQLPKADPLPAEALKQMLEPERVEPLGMLQGNYWLDTANYLGMDFVGALADQPQTDGIGFVRQKLQPSPNFFSRGYYFAKTDGNSLLLKPTEGTKDAVINRSALQVLLHDSVISEGVAIDSAARYLEASGSKEALRLWDRVVLDLALRQDGKGGAGSVGREIDSLRLYGSLSAEQRQLLHQGPLSFKVLSPATLQWMHNYMFGAEMPGAQAEHEPTEELPQGLLPSGTISIEKETTQPVVNAVLPRGGKDLSVSSAINAEALGRYFGQGPMDGKVVAAAKSIKRFRVGTRHEFTIVIQYAPNIVTRHQLIEVTYAPKTFSSFEDLPMEFRQRVEQARLAMAKTIQDAVNGAPPDKESAPPP